MADIRRQLRAELSRTIRKMALQTGVSAQSIHLIVKTLNVQLSRMLLI